MDQTSKKSRAIVLSALLGGVTLAVFWPALRNDFIWFDDGPYITRNPHVMGGITWGNIVWAFSTGYASNWHPLTWVSHMLDAQWFGSQPAGHHLTNLLLHTANAILLFLLFRRLTGAEWRSAAVAGLFALHPLHVESVAWVSERKDVLSTFFLLLALGAYQRYAQARDAQANSATGSGQVGRALGPKLQYLSSLLLFACGLMSKPMVVTFPFLLLLLDHWPLQRGSAPTTRPAARRWLWLVFEKAPFFILAATVSVVTYLVQRQGHALSLVLPLSSRVANAVASYIKYLGKTIWPVDLAVFYPHPDTLYPQSQQWPWPWILLAAAALIIVSAAAWVLRHGHPWLLTGWFWYLATLAPVIGIIQAGGQAMADRYTYIPLVGIFVCLVWTAAQFAGGPRLAARPALGVAAAVALTLCSALTHRQVLYWRNTLTLFQHALEVTKDNAPAHFKVGSVLGGEGDFKGAMEHFRAAIKADPNYVSAYYSLGMALEGTGQPAEAIQQYRSALRIAPWWDATHNRLGMALWGLGQREEACREYEEALKLNPDSADAHFNLGVSLLQLGQPSQAVAHLAQTVQLNPDDPDALTALGRALAADGRPAEGIKAIEQALKIKPDWPGALRSLAWLRATHPQAEVRNGAEAVRLAERASGLGDQKDPRFWAALDAAYAEAGDFAKAVATAQKTQEAALAANEPELAKAAEGRLALYRRHQPFHESERK